MPEVPVKPGMFCWTDLGAPDPDGVKPFYIELFGWSPTEVGAGELGPYTIFSLDGRDVAGLGTQPPEQQEQGTPPMWNSYIALDDVDATTDRARELGGLVLLRPIDVADMGRMAVIRDPTGGVVSFWQSGSEQGSGLYNEPGAMIWNELATRDGAAAADYYGELLGWSFDTRDMHGTTYRIIKNEGRENGGILQMTDEWPDEIPAHWMVYFAVEDVEASVEEVEELGGSVSVPPTDIEVGIMSVVGDPQGGTFTLFENRGEPGE